MKRVKLFEDINDPKLIKDFDKFEIVKNELISKLNSEKLIGNILADLGNFIGQVIFKYIDDNDDSFSEENFITGFEHGVDSMKRKNKNGY